MRKTKGNWSISKRKIVYVIQILFVATGFLFLWQSEQHATGGRPVAMDFDGNGVSDFVLLRFNPLTPPATPLNWIIFQSQGTVYTPPGGNLTVTGNGATATFSVVGTAGTTAFTFIPQGSFGSPPSGYTICPTCQAYDITTTAIYTPPVSVCLAVPAAISSQTFLLLKLLHSEAGVLIDRTTGRFTDGNGNRTVCGSVSSLSPFVLAQASATAAGVSVSGRVLTSADGRGLRNAMVTLTDQSGHIRTALTGRSGYYHFEDVEAGQTYVVAVRSRRFTFTPQALQVNDNLTGVDFVPEP